MQFTLFQTLHFATPINSGSNNRTLVSMNMTDVYDETWEYQGGGDPGETTWRLDCNSNRWGEAASVDRPGLNDRVTCDMRTDIECRVPEDTFQTSGNNTIQLQEGQYAFTLQISHPIISQVIPWALTLGWETSIGTMGSGLAYGHSTGPGTVHRIGKINQLYAKVNISGDDEWGYSEVNATFSF